MPIVAMHSTVSSLLQGETLQIEFPVMCRMVSANGELQKIPTTAVYKGVKVGHYTWETENDMFSVKPPYKINDPLYVCETVKRVCAIRTLFIGGIEAGSEEYLGWKYQADDTIIFDDKHFDPTEAADEFHLVEIVESQSWTSPVYMPKEAARTFLKILDIEVECKHDAENKWYWKINCERIS